MIPCVLILALALGYKGRNTCYLIVWYAFMARSVLLEANLKIRWSVKVFGDFNGGRSRTEWNHHDLTQDTRFAQLLPDMEAQRA